MKILNASLLLFLVLGLFTSCSNDDDDTMVDDDLVGTWELTVFDYSGTSSTTAYGDTYTTDFTGVGRDMTLELVLKSDGTYTSQGSYTIDLTYDIYGQVITIPFTYTGFMGNGTYEINGNQMTATDTDGNTGTAEIISQGNDRLELRSAQSSTVTQGQAVSSFTVTGDYTYERK